MMQPLDKNTLFSIFEAGDEQVYKENGIDDMLKNPFVLMGMVLQGLQSYHLMDIMYKRNFPTEYKRVAEGIKYKYYSRLYGYLNRIESDKFETIYTIGDTFDKEDVFIGLEELRTYFEGIEEYEKCIVIKKYTELLIDKVASLDKSSYL